MSISIAILKYVKRVIRSIGLSQGRQTHRERSRLVRERTAHINRIKGLLFAQGIRGINVKSQYKTLAADELITGDGHRLPPRLACQIGRELQGAGADSRSAGEPIAVRVAWESELRKMWSDCRSYDWVIVGATTSRRPPQMTLDVTALRRETRL